jgi:hypothetical protein
VKEKQQILEFQTISILVVVEMTFGILKGWWKDWICHYEIY